MRRWLFTLILLVSPLLCAATVYKWVDENGVVHYSDQPHPDSQKVQVQAAQTYKAAEAASAAPPGSVSQASGPAAPPYRGCAIAQPGDDQNFTNVDSLTIIVRTDPPLYRGDQIFLLLDGLALNNGAPAGPQFVLTPVDRGTHTVQAVVRNSDGEMRCQTSGVTFNVHQSSVLNPANPLHH
jgi:uncharacterized protein DUF4124